MGSLAVLVHNAAWCNILESKAGQSRPRPLLRKLSQLQKAGETEAGIHAHHIVLKGEYAKTPGIKKWNDLSEALLDKHKIDGLFDLDKAADAVKDAVKKAADVGKKPGRPANLTWAINWDHSTDYVESVYWFLKHADDKGGATGVTNALDKIADVLAQGKKFRCDPKTGKIL